MPRKKRKRIASRGSVNNCILKTLIDGDKYGYEIIKQVQEETGGKVVLKQPSLYSSLGRFEEKGFVVSYWGDSDIGGRRHYYHLTPKGHTYYQREVLKIDSEDIEEINDNFTPPATSKPVFNDEKQIQSSNNIQMVEIKEEHIPAVVNFVKEENKIIPDHQFYSKEPILEKTNEQSNIIIDNNVNTPSSNISEKDKVKNFANIIKKHNHRRSNTCNSRFHYKKPKAKSKIILDIDGIYKLRDENYDPKHVQKSKPHIVDNVIKRTRDTMYGYSSYTDNIKNVEEQSVKELTDEEKRIKNANFLEKFDTITQNKIDSSKDNTSDYQDKLSQLANNLEDTLYEKSSNISEVNSYDQYNNLFNYVDENEDDNQILNTSQDDLDDNFIDLEPEEFPIDNNYTLETIDNSKTQTNLKMNRYEVKSNNNVLNKSYVLINKARFVFGIILGLLLISELTISLIIFKNTEMFFDGDNVVYIMGYIISILITLAYILPYIINPIAHKQNTYKLKYAWMFGLLTFVVSTILFYSINAFVGLDVENIKYFVIKLFVPMILTFNFVICPPIYNKIITSPKYYD